MSCVLANLVPSLLLPALHTLASCFQRFPQWPFQRESLTQFSQQCAHTQNTKPCLVSQQPQQCILELLEVAPANNLQSPPFPHLAVLVSTFRCSCLFSNRHTNIEHHVNFHSYADHTQLYIRAEWHYCFVLPDSLIGHSHSMHEQKGSKVERRLPKLQFPHTWGD